MSDNFLIQAAAAPRMFGPTPALPETQRLYGDRLSGLTAAHAYTHTINKEDNPK